MKKLAMILAVAFTMGLAASTVSASTQDVTPKKTEKKECCAKAKECSKDAKAACGSTKPAEKPAEKK